MSSLFRTLSGVLALGLALTAVAGDAAPMKPPAGPSLCPAGVDAPPRLSLAQLRKRYGARDDKYMTIDGVELRYRDEGRGPVLVLLHGSRSTLNAWDGLTDRLKAHYRIIRFDQPPAGLSGPLSKEAMAAIGSPEALVVKFMDRLHVDKAALVGVSSGGTMAYYVASTYPDRVNALILSNTPSDSVAAQKLASTPGLDAALATVKRLGVEGHEFWQQYLTFLYGDTQRMAPGLVDYYCTINLRTKEPNPFGLHALTANTDATMAHLKGVRAPVLIAWGMKDQVLPPAAAQALLAYLPNAQSRSFVALDSVGHYPPMESPQAVADIIDTYLKRNR